MPKRDSVPTIKDVAQEAGVAIATVSKVINGIPVGESYRIRVEEAVKKLGYRVNPYARGMRGNSTRIIQVVFPHLMNSFYAKLVNGIAKELAQRNYKMMLSLTNGDPALEQDIVSMSTQQVVDGIICLSCSPNLQVPENVSLISIDRYLGARIPWVSSDNFSGGQLAAVKLIENGCKHLAFFRVGTTLESEDNKRQYGFVSICESRGIPFTLKIADSDEPYSTFEEFLQQHIHNGNLDIDGIFCVTDFLAYRISNFLRGLGIRIPEDVQIISYDGLQYSGNLEFYCSSIVQPVDQIAETCVRLMLDEDSNVPVPALVCLPVSYVYGGTTKD